MRCDRAGLVRLWQDEFGPFPPYRLDASALFVGYLISAEYGCHIALGWGQPARSLDPYVEFRHHTQRRQHQERRSGKGFLRPRRRAALFRRRRDRHRAQNRYARPDRARAAIQRRRARANSDAIARTTFARWRAWCGILCRPSDRCRMPWHAAISCGLRRSKSAAAFRSICRCSSAPAPIGTVSDPTS